MTYNATGEKVVDSTGKEWECEVWHPMPIPEGWGRFANYGEVRFLAGECTNAQHDDPGTTHWLVRRRLPDPPTAKMQEELDREAMDRARNKWQKGRKSRCPLTGVETTAFKSGFQAALAYARSGGGKE